MHFPKRHHISEDLFSRSETEKRQKFKRKASNFLLSLASRCFSLTGPKRFFLFFALDVSLLRGREGAHVGACRCQSSDDEAMPARHLLSRQARSY